MPKSFIAKRITSPLYLALVIEAVGDADGTLAGVNATTYEFIMAANSTIGLKPGVPTASGMLIVEAEDFGGQQGTCFGMSDGAVCISPTVEQHASIAITSCATFRAVTGEEPRCAFLSYSTDGSGGSSEPVKKIRAALALAQQQRPDLKIDGEFQTDAAIDERVGSKKVKRPSEVAGRPMCSSSRTPRPATSAPSWFCASTKVLSSTVRCIRASGSPFWTAPGVPPTTRSTTTSRCSACLPRISSRNPNRSLARRP